MSEELAEVSEALSDASTGISDTPVESVSEEKSMGDAYRRIMTQNGADRAPDGKFTSHNQVPDQPSLESEPEAGVAGAAEPEDPSSPSAPQLPQSLAHLPAGMKAAYAKLDDAGRKEMAAFVDTQQRKFGELGKQFGQVKPIHDRLAAAANHLPQLRGMTPEAIVQEAITLAGVVKQFKQDPAAVLLQMAERAGPATIERLRAAFNGQETPPQANQNYELAQIIQGLQQKLDQVGNPEMIQKHVAHTLEVEKTNALVERLSQERPHYSEVEADLPHFINVAWQKLGSDTPREKVFDYAYDMAVNALPEVREKIRKAEAQQATKAVVDPKRTEAAKRANSINVQSSGNGKERNMTEREAMSAAYRRIMNG